LKISGFSRHIRMARNPMNGLLSFGKRSGVAGDRLVAAEIQRADHHRQRRQRLATDLVVEILLLLVGIFAALRKRNSVRYRPTPSPKYCRTRATSSGFSMFAMQRHRHAVERDRRQPVDRQQARLETSSCSWILP
jgi:hypothetical protein